MMLKELRKASRYQYPREDYIREEGPTFRSLGWSMMCITPYHFLNSLSSMGMVFEDDQITLSGGKTSFQTVSGSVDTEKLAEKVRLHAEALLDSWVKKTWVILYQNLRRYRPSVVAFSCILAARRAVGIIPILSERLKEMALLDECFDESVFVEIG